MSNFIPKRTISKEWLNIYTLMIISLVTISIVYPECTDDGLNVFNRFLEKHKSFTEFVPELVDKYLNIYGNIEINHIDNVPNFLIKLATDDNRN